jgi:hypothetical protein
MMPLTLAIAPTSQDENLDQILQSCILNPFSSICLNAGLDIGKTLATGELTDTSNKIAAALVDSAQTGSNSVVNPEIQLLKGDLNAAESRLNLAWSNIISLLVLVLEVLKVLFFLVQLFIIIHIPYWYVKMLVWIQEFVYRKVSRA